MRRIVVPLEASAFDVPRRDAPNRLVAGAHAVPILSDMDTNMNSTYDTKDIYLSSYLISVGFSMDSFLRESGRTTFRFEREETLAQHVNNFYADKAIVSALKYGNPV